MPATELLTQGKHLKTKWLPGRRKREARVEWDGVGHGDRKSSKDSQVGRLPRLACPQGSLALARQAGGSRCNTRFRRWGQHFLRLYHCTSGFALGASDLSLWDL